MTTQLDSTLFAEFSQDLASLFNQARRPLSLRHIQEALGNKFTHWRLFVVALVGSGVLCLHHFNVDVLSTSFCKSTFSLSPTDLTPPPAIEDSLCVDPQLTLLWPSSFALWREASEAGRDQTRIQAELLRHCVGKTTKPFEDYFELTLQGSYQRMANIDTQVVHFEETKHSASSRDEVRELLQTQIQLLQQSIGHTLEKGQLAIDDLVRIQAKERREVCQELLLDGRWTG